MSLTEQIEKKTEGESGIENCIDQDHILPGNIASKIFEQVNRTDGLRPLAITACLDEVHVDRYLHFSHQVGSEEKGSFQNANNERFPIDKGSRKGLGEFSDADMDFFP